MAGTPTRLSPDAFDRVVADNKLVAALGSIPESEVRRALALPWTIVASDAIPTVDMNNHPRGAGTFARTIGRYVRELGVVDLMTGLGKLTVLPARRVEGMIPAMAAKGRVQRGADADLVVFDPATIEDRATIEYPATPSVGIDHVVVAGRLALRDGEVDRSVLAGRPLRSAARVASTNPDPATPSPGQASTLVVEKVAERGRDLVGVVAAAVALGRQPVDEGPHHQGGERPLPLDLLGGTEIEDRLGVEAAVEPVEEELGHLGLDVVDPTERLTVAVAGDPEPLLEGVGPQLQELGGNEGMAGGRRPQLDDDPPGELGPAEGVLGRARAQFQHHCLRGYRPPPVGETTRPRSSSDRDGRSHGTPVE